MESEEDDIVKNADILLFHSFLEYDEVTSLAIAYYTAKENFFSNTGNKVNNNYPRKLVGAIFWKLCQMRFFEGCFEWIK